MDIINNFYLHQLPNGSHITYVRQMLEKTEACAAVSAKAAKYLARFRKTVEAEQEAMRASTKSLLTDAIAAADASRGALYAGFKYAVRAFLRSQSVEHVRAAVVLNQVLIDFRIRTRAPMVDESGLMGKLCRELATTYSREVATLGLGVMAGLMGEANQRVGTLMIERTEERKDVVRGRLRAARDTTDEAYRQLVRMINGLIYVDGEAAYSELVKFVNSNIVYYRREASGRKRFRTDGGDGEEEGLEADDSETHGTELPEKAGTEQTGTMPPETGTPDGNGGGNPGGGAHTE